MHGQHIDLSSRRGQANGWAVHLSVLVTILALVAGCASPAPSSTATGSPGAASPAPASPAVTGGAPSEPPASAPPDAGAWVPGVDLPPFEPVATFEALEATTAGVAVDTAFRLTSLDGSDPVALARLLVAEPPVDLQVTERDGTAIVTPADPLDAGRAYRFFIRGTDGGVRGAWAVQALAPLAVVQTTPYEESTDVPTDTGIEFTFNQHGVTASAVERFLAIDPPTPGRVIVSGRVAAFLPEEPLATGTLYTVRLRAGLPLAGTDETLAAPVVVQFETSGVQPATTWIRAPRSLVETTPDAPAVIALSVDRLDDDGESSAPLAEPLDVTVHRLPGLDAAVAAWRTLEAAPDWSSVAGAPIDTSGLPLALEADVELFRFDEWNDWEMGLALPGVLDAGWYVVTVRLDEQPAQVVLQVTDLMLYAVTTTTRSLAWVNDGATAGPVRGALVTAGGVELGRTGADGIVTGRTPRRLLDPVAAEEAQVIVATSGSRAVFAPTGERLCGKCFDDGGEASPWWFAFNPDRWQYRSTDIVNAWGIVRDRATGDVPERVEVTLDAWTEAEQRGTPVASAGAEPDRNGAFTVALPLQDLPYGSYELTLRVGGKVVGARSISVGRILKPAWSMTLESSRRAVVSGASVDVTTTATFFEGTPVVGAEIRVHGTRGSATLTTDGTGTGTAPAQVKLDGRWSQWDIVEVSARPTLPEEGEIGRSVPVAVFQAAVILRERAVVRDGRLRVTGAVRDVAFERFEASDAAWPGDVNPFGAPVPDATVSIRVTEHWWVRTKAGTRYDWILKRVVPRYDYDERTADRGTFRVTTDADGRFSLGLDARDDRSYELRLATSDAAGRTTVDETWAETVTSIDAAAGARIEGPDTEDGFSVGDRLPLAFVGGPGAGDPATYLWTTAQLGLRSFEITSGKRLVETFRASDVPGFSVNAVRFTGSGYVAAGWEYHVPFRVEDRRLTVAVTADRARYEPGESATLAIRTTDASGVGVPASVYVTVIDEKLVAMGVVNAPDPLEELYAEVGTGIIGVTWTHRDPMPDGGAEGGDTTGGGGDGSSRSDFRDWLVARLVRTGDDGRASISFDLSDDLTSWHAFATGVSSTQLAGSGETSLAVALPFFAELTIADSYLAADRPTVRVRAYGRGLRAGETVTFTVSSPTLEMDPVTVTAPAFRAAEVPLPPLSVGTHRVRVEARTGGGADARRDTLVRTFTVVDHRAVATSVVRAALEGPTAVAAGDGFTTLTLADSGRGRAVPVLESIVAGDPVRGDRALAAGVAARALRDQFGIEGNDAVLGLSLDPFTRDGGYAVLPWAGAELELSALAALAGDPRMSDLSGYFTWAEPTTREARIWRLAGLAATGSPVLGDIRAAAAMPDLTVPEQVALALAALAAGDEALAGRIERDVLRDHGERYGPWVRVRVGAEDATSTVLTARLAIVAASLGDAVAADMDAYLEANPPRTTLIDLERALAARGWALRAPAADASATLTVDGTAREIRVEGSLPVTIVLTPAQARTATLAPASGTVLVTTRTEAPLDPSGLETPTWLDPVRTVHPAGQVGITDLVIVEVRMTPPTRESEGCWLVTEWVPSGLVPVTGSRPYDEETGEAIANDAGPWNVQGQRLDFCLEPDRRARPVVFRYVARVVTPGTYAWEAGSVQSALDPGIGAAIPGGSLVIGGEP